MYTRGQDVLHGPTKTEEILKTISSKILFLFEVVGHSIKQ